MAVLPPPLELFKLIFTTLGSFAAIKGGIKAHNSFPVDALIACKAPLLEPT